MPKDPKLLNKEFVDRLLKEFMTNDEMVKSLKQQLKDLEKMNYSNASEEFIKISESQEMIKIRKT